MITKTVKLLARLSLIPAIMIALLIDSSVNGTIMHIDWLSCIPSLDSFQATLLGATITSYSLFFAVISFISNHFNEDIYGITFQEIYEECYHNASLEYVKNVLVISSFASFFFIFINYLITAVTIFAYVFYQQCKIMLASNLLINEKKKFKVIGCLVTKELIKNRRLDEFSVLYRVSSCKNKNTQFEKLIIFLFRQMQKDNQIPKDQYFLYAYHIAHGLLATGLNGDARLEPKYAFLVQRLRELEQAFRDTATLDKPKSYHVYLSITLGILAAATSEQDSVSGKFFMDVFKDVLNETEVSPSKFILVHALLVIIDLLYMKRIEVEPISEFVSKIRNFRDFQINYQLNIDKTNVKELIYLLCLPLSKFDGIDLEDVHRSLSRIKSDFGDSDSTILRTGPTTYIGYKIRREILYD